MLQKAINIIAFLTLSMSLCLLAVVNHTTSHHFLIESQKVREERVFWADWRRYFGCCCRIPNAAIFYYHVVQVVIYLGILVLCLMTTQYDDILWENRERLATDRTANTCCFTCPESPYSSPSGTTDLCPDDASSLLFFTTDHSKSNEIRLRDRTDLFEQSCMARCLCNCELS